MSRSLGSDVRAGEFMFLNDVYNDECERILHTPAADSWDNAHQVEHVAGSLLRAMHVYSEFPTLDVDDPCHNMPCLPLKVVADNLSYAEIDIARIYSPSRAMPGSSKWLGSLQLFTNAKAEPFVLKMELAQPETWAPKKVLALPNVPVNGGQGNHFLSDAEAMNFIGLVESYLAKLEDGRLAVIRS